ncbi:MAG TPA: squalene/phytoene synthase family protein [Thermoanaerobaculia bacterium]|jgi:farnesyl-diphosphate farnesyltransferase|nr:squalene/phytoene synthase family protein [Thermoanaerobaculia bacterium]
MADLERLLEKTSRTFALSIPVLPEPTRREVMIAYLLFRIADTFEDAAHWAPAERIAALTEFNELLRSPSREKAERLSRDWVERRVAHHAGYQELMAQTPFVLDAFFALSPGAIAPIREHVIRSADGMASIVSRTRDGALTLHSIQELKDYCYLVAGIVGEMLSELFLLDRAELAPVAGFLRERAATFGEALQLVNILKDSAGDAEEGRRYLPEEAPVSEVFALARRDLGVAGEYIRALQKANAQRGIIEFTALPVRLAWAALEKVETSGPGSKVSRPEVFLIVQKLKRALDRDEPAV